MENSDSARSYVNIAPQTDILESEKDYLLALDVPGIEGDSLDVKIDKELLKISALRTTASEEQRYVRNFRVPPFVNAQGVTAAVKDGVLTIVLPKHESVLPKRIAVTVH